MNTNGITKIEMETMNAIIRIPEMLEQINSSVKALASSLVSGPNKTNHTDYVEEEAAELKTGQYFTVKLNGEITVSIKRESEGYVIDVLGNQIDDVLNTMCIWDDQIHSDE